MSLQPDLKPLHSCKKVLRSKRKCFICPLNIFNVTYCCKIKCVRSGVTNKCFSFLYCFSLFVTFSNISLHSSVDIYSCVDAPALFSTPKTQVSPRERVVYEVLLYFPEELQPSGALLPWELKRHSREGYLWLAHPFPNTESPFSSTTVTVWYHWNLNLASFFYHDDIKDLIKPNTGLYCFLLCKHGNEKTNKQYPA